MVQSAEYIYTKLVREELLLRAHSLRPDLGTNKFPVVDIYIVHIYISTPYIYISTRYIYRCARATRWAAARRRCSPFCCGTASIPTPSPASPSRRQGGSSGAVH